MVGVFFLGFAAGAACAVIAAGFTLNVFLGGLPACK